MSAVEPITGPHAHGPAHVAGIMRSVMLALAPATLFGVYLFGWPALNVLLLCIATALASEALCLRIAGKPIARQLCDGSAILTGWLLALSLPPWTPWWVAVIGSAFAIIVGKQIFGGLGQNVFNPAMLARCALLISFPVPLTLWVAPHPLFAAGSPGFMESLAITFGGTLNFDAVSSATVLGHVKTELTRNIGISQSLDGYYDTMQASLGFMGGSLGETASLLILAGGLFLLWRRIITWHIPLAMLGTLALLSGVMHMIDAERYAGPLYHLLTGGAMLGAFFIATDMVTSPAAPVGRIVFGAGCGALTYIIRTYGGYPEGVAFAVLIMNAFTPMIDHYLRPRIYGRDRRGNALSEQSKPE